MKIVIIDLGVSNIKSLLSALYYLGLKNKVVISNEQNEINKSTHLILPGVGSFDFAMKKIKELKLDKIISSLKTKNIKILGICLGMQLLFESSSEGIQSGLSLIDKKCEKLILEKNNQFKIPNVGFKKIEIKKKINNLYDDLDNNYFYFTHSYCVFDCNNFDQYSLTKHNKLFVSSFSLNNIYGCQFHPEKSQSSGLIFLKNFIIA